MVNDMVLNIVNNLIPFMQQEGLYEVLIYYLFLLVIMLFIISMFFSATKRRTFIAPKSMRTVTVLQCEKCDYKEEREFQVGDYVFKKVGECSKCRAPLYISMIYGLPEKPSP
ncbi:MAG: hypothetical protein QW701_05810 [Candidatus Nezhaarchaeales archaeon]